MKTLIFLLAFISATWPALGAITNSDRANIQATNRLSNGGFENGLSGWVTSGTAAGVTFGLDTTNFTDGLASFTFTKTGSASGSFIVTKDQATTAQLTGRNFEVTCQVENPFTPSGTPDQLCGRVNGVSTNCVTLPVGAGFQTVTTTIQPVTGDSFGAQVVWGNPSAGTGKIDECYVGPSRNIGTVQQARFLGSVAISGCAGGWVSTSTSFAAFPVQTTCVYTTEGLASPPATMLPAITVPSQGPGSYWLSYEGTIQTTSAGSSSSYQFTDGTTAAKEVSFLSNGSSGTSSATINQHITYTSAPPSSITFQIFGKQSSGSVIVNGTTANPGVIKVYYFPASAQQVYQASSGGLSVGDITPTSLGTCPIGTTLANGGSAAAFTQLNNAYVTAGYPYGGSAGTANLPDYRGLFIRGVGTNGTALQANGGAVTGAALGTLQNDMLQGHLHPINTTQSYASGGFATINSSSTAAGGTLATTPGALVSDGSNGTPRVGAETHPANLSATYCVRTVPASPAPILTNSITTNAAGAWRHEFGYVTNNGSTCVASGGTNFMTASRSGVGTCVITFNSAFSGNSICESNQDLAGASGICNAYSDSATGTNVNCTNNGFGAADRNFKLTCDGPR
jgi:hypothetical protein